MSAQHTPGPTVAGQAVPMRRAYEQQYPEMRGVSSKAARAHYAAFQTGWFCALSHAKATGSTS